MWNEIRTEKDITLFMESIDYFHDSCLKELKYTSGAYVAEDLSMLPINRLRVLKMIIQRQAENPSAIELVFTGLNYCKLVPCSPQFTCEILDATLLWKDGNIFWADRGGLTASQIERYSGTVISAAGLKWRVVNAYIGCAEVYETQHITQADANILSK